MAKRNSRTQAAAGGADDTGPAKPARTTTRAKRGTPANAGISGAQTTADPIDSAMDSGSALAVEPSRVVTAAHRSAGAARVEPSDEDIRRRAYLRYLERGASPGDEVEDWVSAERELGRKFSK